MQKSLIEVMD